MASVIEKEWTTKAGLRAVVRDITGRHRCGYVGVPVGHPFYGLTYSDEIPALADSAKELLEKPIGKRGIITVFCAAIGDGMKPRLDILVDVHGSITFSDHSGDYPASGDEWWFGFDCAHCDDTRERCDLAFCVDECESMAEQLQSLSARMPVAA